MPQCPPAARPSGPRGAERSSNASCGGARSYVLLWEADRAVVRAGLTGALPGRQLTPGSGLSTADAGPDLPWARKWRVVEALPLRPKRIRAWLRSRDIGRVTVKKRHASIDPERLRRELATGRDGAITLIVTTIGDTGAAIAVTPAD